MAQLGKAISVLVQWHEHCNEMFEDLAGFHAPSECYQVVEHGLRKKSRLVCKRACAIAGAKNMRVLERMVKKQMPNFDKWCYTRYGTSVF